MNIRKPVWMGVAGVLCALFLTLYTPASAAPITAAPTRLTQPDGTVLELYSSGDEFFNYIHDQAGNLVMRRSDGWYVYAQSEDGVPVPTGDIVGEGGGDWASLFSRRTMTVGDIDFAAHPELTADFEMAEAAGEEVYLDPPAGTGDFEQAQLFATDSSARENMANLVIFIRFKGESEYITLDEKGDPIAPIPPDAQMEGLPDTIRFGDSYAQVSRYMQTVSNGSFDVVSTFLSADETGSVILSYEDRYPRAYYEGIEGSSDERFYAEMELLERALATVAGSIPAGTELDYDHDGYVDNITFIVSGSTSGWSNLLWPHSWALQRNKILLQNRDGTWKQCYHFNFNFANPRYAGVGVLSHELLHVVGYPDLYRYDYSGDPVGAWDAMGSTDYADPQFIGAYLKDAYTDWGNLGHISASGTYTLWPLGTQTASGGPAVEGYQIPTGTVGEYICVEYRKSGQAGDVTEDNVPGDGLLVYRANRKTTQGNRNGTTQGGDEVYVFRPGDAYPNAGTKGGLSTAALDGVTRTALGEALDSDAAAENTLYLDNGQNSGIIIDQVEVLPDGRVSFRVTLNDDPTPIVPSRYDVDGDDYFIGQSGDYAFYGSTTRHHITVAAGVKDVSIAFEAADMDLSAVERNVSPLAVRAGAEVTVSLVPDGQGQSVTLLAGSAYMPGVKVEKGARLTVLGAGGELNASGGVGAPGLGSDAFSPGGSVHLKDLTATFSGGGSYKLSSGGSLIAVSEGSAALGGGFHQTMDELTVENCTVEALGANSVQAISTGYLDLQAGVYVPGGPLTILNSRVTAQGSVDAGAELRVENATLSASVSNSSYYSSALNATERIALTNTNTTLTAQGSNAGMNRNTRDTCVVEVRGGSLHIATGSFSGIAGRTIAISPTTDLVITTEGTQPIVGPWSDEGTSVAAGIVAPAGEEPGVFLQGTFATATAYRTIYSLTDSAAAAGRYVELPAGTRTFLVSLPQTGTYVLRDEDAAASGEMTVALKNLNQYPGNITLQSASRLERAVDVSRGGASLTQSGTYILSGAGTGSVSVSGGLNVTIYLDNVTIDAAGGSALSIGANTKATIIAKRSTENYLTGATGSPAVSGAAGSTLAFGGSGLIVAHGGAGAPGVAGQGSVSVEQVTALVALSDTAGALTRPQADTAAWSPITGAAPTVTRLTLAQALPGDDLLTLFTSNASYRIPAQGGVRSLFFTLSAPGQVTLERADGAATGPLDCPGSLNSLTGVTFLPAQLQQGGTLDLSEKSHTITRSGAYTVTGTTSENTLRVAPGVSAYLRFDNVTVTGFAQEVAAIVDLGAGSVTTIELLENTQNRLEITEQRGNVNAIHVPSTARLTILGSGSLTVSGGANTTTVGAAYNGEGGVISIQGGDITFKAPAGSGNSRWALGGTASRVDISGGTLRHSSSYGAGIGGQGARVTIRGGDVTWRTAERMPIGGEQSAVTITGGSLTMDLTRGGVGIGGAGSRVSVQGGQIALLEPDGGVGVSAALGGRDSQLTITGGAITGTLQKPLYNGYGGLGGENAAATVSGDATIFLRYRHKDARPVANDGLFASGQNQSAFLDIHLRAALAAAETLTLTREEDGKQVSVPLESGDAGFFIRLEEGVWNLENTAGGYGGAYSLTPGVTTQADVTFDRLRGVFLESKTVEYSGAAHTLTVRGLPTGASVRYTNNSQREPGTYAVTAAITTPTGSAYTLDATLTITKARLTVTGVRADDKVYNGNTAATGRVLFTGAKGSDVPVLSATFRFRDSNAGTGKTVTASNVQLGSALWAGRYVLSDVDPALLTTQADITPKSVAFTFSPGSLRQMAGAVRPVVPSFRESGLAAGDVSVTYTDSNGVTTAAVPQEAGEYTVAAVIADPNYQPDGSATVTLLVETGFDLQTGDAVITAPGEYTITSHDQPTGHRIIVDSAVSGNVKLYLNGVCIQAAAGQSAVELQYAGTTTMFAQEGTQNRLVGGSGGAAVSTVGDTYFAGEGELFLQAGEGSVAAQCANSFHDFYASSAQGLWLVSNESDPAQRFSGTKKWVTMTFAEKPAEDTAFTLTVAGKATPFTLPAGYQKVWRAVNSVDLWSRTTLQDRNGDRLCSGTTLSGNLNWTGIPLIAPARQSFDLDVSKAPHSITQSGIYRVHGTYRNDAATAPVLTIADGLEVELILDNVAVRHGSTTLPLISLGKGADATLTARGESLLYSWWTPVVWENCGTSDPSGSVKLRGEAGGSVELQSDCFASDSSAKNAAIYADVVSVESGAWSIEMLAVNRNANVWCVRTREGFSMTGGQVSMVGDTGKSFGVGGIYAGEGDVSITGGALTVQPYRTGQSDSNGGYSGKVAGIYLGHGKTFTIDGGQVSIDQERGADGVLLRDYDGAVRLLSGALEMSIGIYSGDSYGIYCKDLTVAGDFTLLGLDGSPMSDPKDAGADNNNYLLVQPKSGSSITYLPGPDGNVPVLYRGQFNNGNGLAPNAYKDTEVVFTDGEGVERTLILPKRDSVNKYLNFLVLLPHAGRYDVSYEGVGGKDYTTAIEVTAEGEATGGMGTFTQASTFSGVELLDQTVLWDGAPKTLSVAHNGLPGDAAVNYTYDTPDAQPPVEPGEYAVTARLTAQGYTPKELSATLTIQKRPLELQISVEDKAVYDGSTQAQGLIVVSGALPGDSFTATADFHFATADVGSDKTVNITNLQVTGGPENWAAHYDLVIPQPLTATASILEKATLTVVWNQPSLVQTYGDTGPVGAVLVAADGTDSPLKPTLLYDGDEDAPTLPGLYPVTAQLDHPNYQASDAASLRIQPRGLTITALQAPDAVRGEPADKTVETATGFTLADPGLVPGDEVGIRYLIHYQDLTVGADRTAEITDLTLTGDHAGRYYVVQYPTEVQVTVLPEARPDVLYQGTLDGAERSLEWVYTKAGELTVSGPLASDEMVVAACYDGEGCLLNVKFLTAQSTTASLDPATPRVKLFWLNRACQPLCPSETAWEKG